MQCSCGYAAYAEDETLNPYELGVGVGSALRLLQQLIHRYPDMLCQCALPCGFCSVNSTHSPDPNMLKAGQCGRAHQRITLIQVRL